MPLPRPPLPPRGSGRAPPPVVWYIGIDPGVSGGMCLLNPSGEISDVTKMPPTPIAIHHWLKGKVKYSDVKYRVSLEKVGGYIGGSKNKDGGEGNTGSSMFVFGRSYGMIEGVLTSVGLYPVDSSPVPTKWQRAVGVSPREDWEKPDDYKRRLKVKAMELFPDDPRITLHTCDAILIAYYLFNL